MSDAVAEYFQLRWYGELAVITPASEVENLPSNVIEEAARMILVLIGSGIPFERLIDVARGQLVAGADMAEGAVRLLDEFNPVAQTSARNAAVMEMASVIGSLVSYVVQSQVMAVGRNRPVVMSGELVDARD